MWPSLVVAARGPCLIAGGQPFCYGPTGAVSRAWRGEHERVAAGLPSLAGANGVAQAGPAQVRSPHGRSDR